MIKKINLIFNNISDSTIFENITYQRIEKLNPHDPLKMNKLLNMNVFVHAAIKGIYHIRTV